MNDGSTDETLQILEGYSNLFNFKSYTLKENRGILFARSFGFSKVIDEFAMSLDADDELSSDVIAKARK